MTQPPSSSLPKVDTLSTMPSGRLAAVAYLNMLPFFADDPHIQLFSSPRELNAQRPHCLAYCSSLIAGLNTNKRPLSPQFGVFSSGAVQSVFIEPVLHSDKHTHFWNQLEEFWAHKHPDPVASLAHPEHHGHIVLRSNGASDQSVWMIKVLTSLAGFSLELREDSDARTSTRLNADGEEKPLPEARLWIGDPALIRTIAAPETYRIDIGQIWNTHMGHKAWFAGWFMGTASNEHETHIQSISSELNRRIDAWSSRSEFSRWCAMHAFLEHKKSSLLSVSLPNNSPASSLSRPEDINGELRGMMNDYFASLTFHLDANEGRDLLAFYLALQAAMINTQNSGALHGQPAHGKSLQRCSVAGLTT